MFKINNIVSLFLPFVVMLLMAIGTQAFAQTNDDDDDGEPAPSPSSPSNPSEPGEENIARLSTSAINTTVNSMTLGISNCKKLLPTHQFDCYRKVYQLAANRLGGNPDYAKAQTALIAVEKTLENIISQNSDTNPPPVDTRTALYAPIKASAVAAATAEFEKALDLAETALLRSPDHSKLHYTRIAEVVHSNKVLLRS